MVQPTRLVHDRLSRGIIARLPQFINPVTSPTPVVGENLVLCFIVCSGLFYTIGKRLIALRE
jgi:hypothetical protein